MRKRYGEPDPRLRYALAQGYRERGDEENALRLLKSFIREEDGIGTVEMILILVVLIGLVLIFKSQLTDLVNDIFKTITNKAGQV